MIIDRKMFIFTVNLLKNTNKTKILLAFRKI